MNNIYEFCKSELLQASNDLEKAVADGDYSTALVLNAKRQAYQKVLDNFFKNDWSPNWDEAPADAVYCVVDSQGDFEWWSKRPKHDFYDMQWVGVKYISDGFISVGGKLDIDVTNWRNMIYERPWSPNWDEAPINAKYLVFNESGLKEWWKHKPILWNNSGWRNDEDSCEGFISWEVDKGVPAEVKANWQNMVWERPSSDIDWSRIPYEYKYVAIDEASTYRNIWGHQLEPCFSYTRGCEGWESDALCAPLFYVLDNVGDNVFSEDYLFHTPAKDSLRERPK